MTTLDPFCFCVFKEFAPCDEELAAYRRGEEWDPVKAEEEARLKVICELPFILLVAQ